MGGFHAKEQITPGGSPAHLLEALELTFDGKLRGCSANHPGNIVYTLYPEEDHSSDTQFFLLGV